MRRITTGVAPCLILSFAALAGEVGTDGAVGLVIRQGGKVTPHGMRARALNAK